ncbi:MAG: YedE-related selenium metabolism membrane protein [Planctomycetaceae bacterium]|nr:MAG: YedE-related selenium metabolism membrane protein [Planctomycetaceae bacterium]
MSTSIRLLTSRWGPILTGVAVGILGPLLVFWGNPGNMGVCVACFTRDIAGALGLHRAAVVQYIRPELIGFVLGSMIAARMFGEFRPRTGSAPIVRFVLGMLAMIGALVFLGCTWRVYLRLAAGDLNALVGVVGLVAGISLGVFSLRSGFSLGRNRPTSPVVAWVMPVIAFLLLAALMFPVAFGRDAGGNPMGPIFFSESGPGSQHARIWIALSAGLLIGSMAQRSRFCTVGAVRDVILMRDLHLFSGVIALVGAACVTALVLGQFRIGWDDQPVAHTDGLWNFGGMLLAGWAFTLAGGCPGRQLILVGEGDGDAAVFTMGMLLGAALAHNFSVASTPAGPGVYGPAAVIAGLVICGVIGGIMREPPRS